MRNEAPRPKLETKVPDDLAMFPSCGTSVDKGDSLEETADVLGKYSHRVDMG